MKQSIKRIWAVFYARNLEFLRDKDSMIWSMVFPFFLLVGFYFVFGQSSAPPAVNIGITGPKSSIWQQRFKNLPQVQSLALKSATEASQKLSHHRIDLWLDTRETPPRYQVSATSPNGYLAERLVIYEWEHRQQPAPTIFTREVTTGEAEVPYLEWFFPGLLGMNMMFSAVFGVGYVVVRYRKNGVLKRLAATPLTAFEFLSAQLASRLFLIAFNTVVLMAGGLFLFHFPIKGSLTALALVFLLGSSSMIALGSIVSARTESEELANGLLNLMTLPMMFLGEVWFSLESAADWVKHVSLYLPLTHLIQGARAVMNDGAGLYEVQHHLYIMGAMTVVFLSIGAGMFRWQKK